MLQASTAVIPPIIENIPEQLTARPQWVCWCLEERDGNMTKMPYIPGTVRPRRASSNDLMTWRTFSEALEAYELGEPAYDGIGFMFCSADPFSGIDLDKCRDPETGEVEGWAQEIIDEVFEGYAEVSPSGTGVHIIVPGVVRGGAVKRGCIEMYSQTRFFTVTGRVL